MVGGSISGWGTGSRWGGRGREEEESRRGKGEEMGLLILLACYLSHHHFLSHRPTREMR